MSVHVRNDGRWYCQYYEGGKRKFKYFGRGPDGQALARRCDETLKREKGKVPTTPGGLTVTEVLLHYHEQHPVAREIDLLRAAMNWAEDQDPPLIFRNAVRKFRVPRGKESDTPNPPRRAEVEKLLAVSPPHLVRALVISWACGLRPGGEVSRLTWSDYDQDARELRVISARKGGPVIRNIPLPPHLVDALNAWLDADIRGARPGCDIGRVPIVHYHYRPTVSLKRSWATAKRKAGITRRLRPYDLRHAWFTNALQLGGDIKAISEIGGHSRIDTTLRFYDHVTQERHRAAMEKIQGITVTVIRQSLGRKDPDKQAPQADSQLI